MLKRVLLAVMLCCAVQVPQSVAAESFPEREISLVIGYGPGGNTDLSARAMATAASRILGKPVVVSNRPGANGIPGPAALLQSRPNGYTVALSGAGAMLVAPHMVDVGYRPFDDFDFIVGFGRLRYGLAVPVNSPFRSVQDFVRAGQTGRLTFAATGAPNTVPMFELAKLASMNLRHVPFTSEPDAVAAAVGGHVDAVLQSPNGLLPYIQSGRLRLLASASAERWVEYPDVPTLIESGYKTSAESVLGFIVRKGTPKPVRETLERAFVEAAKDPEVRKLMESIGMTPLVLTGSEYEASLMLNREAVAEAVKASGAVK